MKPLGIETVKLKTSLSIKVSENVFYVIVAIILFVMYKLFRSSPR